MEGNNLAGWQKMRNIVVLEGLLAVPTASETTEGLLRRKKIEVAPPEEWRWSDLAVKSLQNYARLNQIMDVVTFISQEVAEAAADWFLRYGVNVASTEYVDFNQFCASLRWRGDIQSVYEASPTRIVHYGQHGVAVVGGRF